MARLFGLHAIADLLDEAPHALTRIFFAPSPDRATQALLTRAEALQIPTVEAPAATLREHAGSRSGASLAAELRVASAPDLDALDPATAPVLVALDQVTDPHNLGAILRSADAFGAAAVIVPRDHAAPLNHAAVRASAGAVAHVPVLRGTNLARALVSLHERGYWPLAITGDASKSLWDQDVGDIPVVAVLGAEGGGIRPGVRRACPLAAHLPMSGRVQSLNVSVATGAALAEIARQRAKRL